jgi:methyl-accepting chemotaxis protein
MPASQYPHSGEPHAQGVQRPGKTARWSPQHWRFRYRLVAGMVAVLLPVVVVLAVLLTARASDSLTKASENKGQSVARAVAVRLEDWVAARRQNLTLVAGEAPGREADAAFEQLLVRSNDTYPDFALLEIADLSGKVLVTSRNSVSVDPSGMDWFRTAASGQPVTTSLTEQSGHLRWFMAQPVLGVDGRPEAVAIALLDPVVLGALLNPELDQTTDVVAVDSGDHLDLRHRAWPPRRRRPSASGGAPHHDRQQRHAARRGGPDRGRSVHRSARPSGHRWFRHR